MIRRIINGLFFSGFWIYGAIGGNALAQTPSVTITLQSAPTSISSTGTGSAYYVVNLNGQFPYSSLTMSYLSGMPAGVAQQLTGAAPCTGGVTTLCANPFNLTPGNSCCLAFTLTGSQMSIGANTLLPVIGTTGTPTSSYSYYPTSAANVQVGTSPVTAYSGIYVETNNSLVTYSPDNGTTWGYMLSPQGGWYWNEPTRATATTTDGTLYQATGVTGNSVSGNGAATLIYSQDGITWSQVATFPTDADWVQSVFAVGNTVYVGTGNGYVYYTSNQGVSWGPASPAQVLIAGTVNAIVVDANGIFYAGTSGGNIYYSSTSGQSWIALPSQSGVTNILSLAIDTSGTLYEVTNATTTQPQYNTAPLTTGAWQLMTALPAGDGNATTIAASGTTVYVGTNSSYVLSTSNKGQNWTGNQVPNDTSGITSLSASQTSTLSPLFVESYGTIPITSSTGTGIITVKNLSSTTATNVQADSLQLPTGVTQTSTPCASVAAGSSCSITFSASTSGFAPTAFNIIDSSNNTVSRSALVSSITPNSGTDYYYVYYVNGSIAYAVDNNDASGGIIWSSNNLGTYDGGIAIYGISEASTTSSPDPSTGSVTGQTACNGATDGSCDANNIYIYYQNNATGFPIPTTDYAEGLCYQDTAGGAAGTGQWYLPAACEFNGGIYLNVTTNNFESCSPATTGILSLNSLGTLGGPLASLATVLASTGKYWSSTEFSGGPQFYAWYQYFASGGGSKQSAYNKVNTLGVRCSRALSI